MGSTENLIDDAKQCLNRQGGDHPDQLNLGLGQLSTLIAIAQALVEIRNELVWVNEHSIPRPAYRSW